jgi:hypothetical protein
LVTIEMVLRKKVESSALDFAFGSKRVLPGNHKGEGLPHAM